MHFSHTYGLAVSCEFLLDRVLCCCCQELPAETKDVILKELQLSSDVTRCCSSCFNRIARKIGNNPQTNEPLVPLVPEAEIGQYLSTRRDWR